MKTAMQQAAKSGIGRVLATLMAAALLMSAAVLTAGTASAQGLDTDGDRIEDAVDNCPTIKNRQQNDLDGDGLGNKCDDDIDGDGVLNDADARPRNPEVGIDTDGDRINDDVDNCPDVKNRNQNDLDGDGVGNKCDDDIDGDGIPNADDDRPRKEDPVTEIEIEVVDLGELDAEIIVIAPSLPTIDIDEGPVANPFVPNTAVEHGDATGGCNFVPQTDTLTLSSSVNVGTFELAPATTQLAPVTMAQQPIALEPLALQPLALEPSALTVTDQAPLVYEAPLTASIGEPTLAAVAPAEITLDAVTLTANTPSVCN